MLTENIKTQESFQQILERSLNGRFSSRPPKLEISGVLTPIHKAFAGKHFKFKIVTDKTEYILSMNSELYEIAKKLEWEDVTARGYLDSTGKILSVEKLTARHSPDDARFGGSLGDNLFDLEFYRRAISKAGVLEPEPGYLVS